LEEEKGFVNAGGRARSEGGEIRERKGKKEEK
jgi:hypothetical protein